MKSSLVLLATRFCLLATVINAACPDANSLLAAQAGCSGTFVEYPINGTVKPYTCTNCGGNSGGGLICPGGNCPVAQTVGELFSNACPTYTTATDDYSCAALQQHCEDSGEGYLLYAKVYLYSDGSRFSCSNCSGFFNVEIDDTLEVQLPGTEIDADLFSPFMLFLFVGGFIMLVIGLYFEIHGKSLQNAERSKSDVGFSVCGFETQRFFGHIDAHEKPRTLGKLLWQEAIFFRYCYFVFCRCCQQSEEEEKDEREEREIAEDRLYDRTFAVTTLFLSVAVAYLLNGLRDVEIQCELAYDLDRFVLGVADSDRVDPFLSDIDLEEPIIQPPASIDTFPRIIEDERHLLTLYEQIEARNLTASTEILYDILQEEIFALTFLVGLEKFLRGAEEMKHWSMTFLGNIHIVIRFMMLLFCALAVSLQQLKLGVDVYSGIWAVGANWFYVLLLLTFLLPLLGLVRWFAGYVILACLGLSVPGAEMTCATKPESTFGQPQTQQEYADALAPTGQKIEL